jgi:hypothetical protein
MVYQNFEFFLVLVFKFKALDGSIKLLSNYENHQGDSGGTFSFKNTSLAQPIELIK